MRENVGDWFPGTAQVDLGAVKSNIEKMRSYAGDAQLMAVVKANAYGHGRTEIALTALDSGITWLGVSQLSEALELRASLDALGVSREDARIFTWLAPPDADWGEALDAGLHLSASSVTTLRSIAFSAKQKGLVAPVHVKIDVGMGRGGSVEADFVEFASCIKSFVDSGDIEVFGLWSHMSQADDPFGPGKEVSDRQIARLKAAEAVLSEKGIVPQIRHLAATAGTIWHPDSHFDLVRIGVGLYGLSPDPQVASAESLGLWPALTLQAPLVLVKRVKAGDSVSYGGTWTATDANWVGLVPLGYADGIPRAVSNRGSVAVETDRGLVSARILGRVCMDQFVIDLGDGEQPLAKVGDNAVLFGGDNKVPLADDWAECAGTINYEIIARLAPTIRREYVQSRRGLSGLVSDENTASEGVSNGVDYSK